MPTLSVRRHQQKSVETGQRGLSKNRDGGLSYDQAATAPLAKCAPAQGRRREKEIRREHRGRSGPSATQAVRTEHWEHILPPLAAGYHPEQPAHRLRQLSSQEPGHESGL